MTNKNNKLKNPIIMAIIALICCALWGSATPAIKTGYKLLSVDTGSIPSIILFAGLRFLLAGILTIIIFSVAKRRFIYPAKKNIKLIMTVGVFQTILQYLLFYVGLAYTTGVKGTVTSGSGAFFSVIIASLIFKQEKLTPKKIIACIIGFLGIVVINFNGLSFSADPLDMLGVIAVLFSAIVSSVSSVLIKRFSDREDPVVISGYQFVFGGVAMTLIGLILGGEIAVSDVSGVLILVYLGFLSAIAYSLWGLILKFNSVSRVSVFNFTTPIFGTVMTMIIFPGENSTLSPINIVVTLALVSTGILLLNYKPKSDE